jgi:arylsulfatase A-like enzyme
MAFNKYGSMIFLKRISFGLKDISKYFFVGILIFNKLIALGQGTPNIIFILTDDQSPIPVDAVKSSQSRPFGFNGDRFVHTPNIDNLAQNGLVFSRAYVSSSVCSPSRYSILTGRYAGRCEGNAFMRSHPPGSITRVENNTELEQNRENLPRLLQEAGYHTGFVGKSHIIDHHLLGKTSYNELTNPMVSKTIAAQNHEFWVNRIKEFGFDYANAVYAANLKELHNDTLNVHNVEWLTHAALDFIDQANEKPFFLYLSHTIPHGPAPWIKRNGKYIFGLDADPQFTGEGFTDHDFSFMPQRNDIRAEIESMHDKDPDHAWLRWFDHSVGSIIQKLKENGLYENTLIVITSDHGNYNHGKATLYESGVKVPLLMHWPAGIRYPGSEYQELVQNIDFAPTFLDLAGVGQVSSLKLDGVSLKKVLKGYNGPVHDYLFFEIGYARGVATIEWKYIAIRYDKNTEEKIEKGITFKGWNANAIPHPYYIRNGQLGHHASTNNANYFFRDQLYDLSGDPHEKVNVFNMHPEKANEMRELLIRSLNTFEKRPYGEFVD